MANIYYIWIKLNYFLWRSTRIIWYVRVVWYGVPYLAFLEHCEKHESNISKSRHGNIWWCNKGDRSPHTAPCWMINSKIKDLNLALWVPRFYNSWTLIMIELITSINLVRVNFLSIESITSISNPCVQSQFTSVSLLFPLEVSTQLIDWVIKKLCVFESPTNITY